MQQRIAQFVVEARPRMHWQLGRLRTYALASAFGSVGERTVIISPNQIVNPAGIYIGKDCAIYDQSWLQAEKPNGQLVIGDNVYIGHRAHLHATGRIEIGDDCFITDDVLISDGEHDPVNPSIVRTRGEIRIGRSVFIGNGAYLLGGITVGDRARVAARAVVTRDVPAGATVAGIPARVVSESR